MARIVATLPDGQARAAMHHVMNVWRPPARRPELSIDLDLLRQCCWEEVSLHITYHDLSGRESQREIWPLALSYGEQTLMLLAHCRLRDDYRYFHVARIRAMTRGDSFRPRRVPLLRTFSAAHRAARAAGEDGISGGPRS